MFPNLSLYIIGGSSANFLGRNWLSEVKLDWTILFAHCEEKLNDISKAKDISEN